MNKPAPVYLLLGPESGNKSKKVREIRNLCKTFNKGKDAELHRFYPFETEQGEILVALQNISLFTGYRLVLLAEAENLKVPQAKTIAKYLKHPSDSATLIIISAHNKIHPSIQNAVPQKQRQIFWELFENQKKDWLIDYFSTRNLEISLEAVELMLSLVENNTQELRVASQQLILYISDVHKDDPEPGQIEITEDDIEAFIFHSRQESVFTLFDQIANGNLEESLDILKTLQLSRDTDPIQLFGGLLWQFRRLYSYLCIIEDGDSEIDAFTGITILGKPSAIRGKHNQQIYRNAANHYGLKDIEQIISYLCKTDGIVRELGKPVQSLLLERLLYVIIRHKGRPIRQKDVGLAITCL